MAIVATAGTTDFGSIDPLSEVAALAMSCAAWFHVDAAYGSALILSGKHRDELRGMQAADSVGMDFHKLFWQPISCAAFLLRDARHLDYLKMHVDYLNPEEDEERGVPNLVNRSVATTRRFDALKLWISLQTVGREKLGEMVDATIALAVHATECIGRNPLFQLMHRPSLGCVVFRYLPANAAIDANAFNAELRQRLFERGLAVIGHTVLNGRQCLKLTFMNPTVSEEQVENLLEIIVKQGKELERQFTERS